VPLRAPVSGTIDRGGERRAFDAAIDARAATPSAARAMLLEASPRLPPPALATETHRAPAATACALRLAAARPLATTVPTRVTFDARDHIV
jgi:hypothetical protein